MRMTLLGTHATLLSCAAALLTATAWAQDAPPAPAPAPATPPPAAAPAAPPAAEAAPPPAAPPPPAETPAPAAAGAAPAAPAAETAAAAPAGPAGWFRIDADLTGYQLWAGAVHPLGEGIGLASDIYLAMPGSLAEFDLGPAITAGPFTITPMIGYQIDFARRRSNSIVPQLYVTGGPDPIYMEFWFQNYENQVFKDGAANDIYMRLFVNYKFSPFVSVGPEIEPWFALNESGGRDTGVSSFVVGGNVMFFSYGTNSTLQLFVGYETKEAAQKSVVDDEVNNKLGGRFSFVHNW